MHGMIAGGTGSGKSELLMTLIVGLALNYSPDILNFVLVDYKGGGAFQPFQRPAALRRYRHQPEQGGRRPHVHRHQCRDPAPPEAERRNRHQGYRRVPPQGAAPDPRALPAPVHHHRRIRRNDRRQPRVSGPSWKASPASAARIGVNLVLASQRPKGVTDQMRANIKLRLCLRVEQIDTSRELLRKPDAAFLPNGIPGRGYMQIGNDALELIQVSYTGETQPDDREPAVLWPDRTENRGWAARVTEEAPKLYDAVVNLASELVGWQMAPKPWPAFLPRQISLQSPIVDAQHNSTFTLTTTVTDWLNGDWNGLWPGVDWQDGAMRSVVGLVDDPSEARQFPLQFDLSRNHLVVFGDSGWGKTSFLRTLVAGLAATHSPERAARLCPGPGRPQLPQHRESSAHRHGRVFG